MLANWDMMESMQGPCCCALNLNGRKQIFALRGSEFKPLSTRLLWICSCTCLIELYDAAPRMTHMRSALLPGPRAWLWPPLLSITSASPSNRICPELLFRFCHQHWHQHDYDLFQGQIMQGQIMTLIFSRVKGFSSHHRTHSPSQLPGSDLLFFQVH